MPLIIEQKRINVHPTRPSQRLSNIPRPIKHLVIDGNTKISHASKPTVDTLPLTSTVIKPSNKLNSKLIVDKDLKKPKISVQDADPELAILELLPFSRQPIVNFGQVQLNTTKIRYVLLRNPMESQQQLFVKTFPKNDKGFYIDATEFLIAPNTEICVALAWTPKIVGALREVITMQDMNRMPKRIVLMGTAFQPKPEHTFSSKSSRNVPKLFRSKRGKITESPRRLSTLKPIHGAKPITKLIVPSPKERHQIVRKILSKRDDVVITRVQSYFRMLLALKNLAEVRERRDQAVRVIQNAWRKHVIRMAKRREKSATIIQGYWRGFVTRQKYLSLRLRTINLQRLSRGLMYRRRLKRSIDAIQIIQHLDNIIARVSN